MAENSNSKHIEIVQPFSKDLGLILLSLNLESKSKAYMSKLFKSEGEALQWLIMNTPLAIKQKAKTTLVSPFTSNNAFLEVSKHLAKELYKL